jgi:hypothetical protein
MTNINNENLNIKANKMISEDGDSYCIITTSNMRKIAALSIDNEFNRIIPLDIVDGFTNDFCLVFMTMIHEHKKGIKVDPHIRLLFYASQNNKSDTQIYILDTEVETFEEYAEYRKC